MNKIAICPGSYDPVTIGHEDLIKRALSVFGMVEVVAMYNPEKNYMFPIEKRLEMLKEAFRDYGNITCTMYSGMLYEYLAGRNDAVIVKGVRNGEDLIYEKKMAEFNFAHSGTETLFFAASENLAQISSTLVKQKMSAKADYLGLLPNNIVKFFPNNL